MAMHLIIPVSWRASLNVGKVFVKIVKPSISVCYGYFDDATLAPDEDRKALGGYSRHLRTARAAPGLAVLQYRWVGQVSTAERERMQRNLRTAAGQFRENFDGEMIRAVLSLQVGPATALEGTSERYTDRYETWLNTSAHPQVVAAVLLVDSDAGRLRLRRWNPDTHTFEATDWPTALGDWRARFEQELSDFTAGRPPSRRGPFRGDDSTIVTPLRNLVSPRSPAPVPQTVTPVFGFTIIQLNMAYIREQMLPELAERHFIHADGDVYRVSVTNSDDPAKVLYQSDPGAPVERSNADATAGLSAAWIRHSSSLALPFGRRRPRSTAWSSVTPRRDAG